MKTFSEEVRAHIVSCSACKVGPDGQAWLCAVGASMEQEELKKKFYGPAQSVKKFYAAVMGKKAESTS